MSTYECLLHFFLALICVGGSGELVGRGVLMALIFVRRQVFCILNLNLILSLAFLYILSKW